MRFLFFAICYTKDLKISFNKKYVINPYKFDDLALIYNEKTQTFIFQKYRELHSEDFRVKFSVKDGGLMTFSVGTKKICHDKTNKTIFMCENEKHSKWMYKLHSDSGLYSLSPSKSRNDPSSLCLTLNENNFNAILTDCNKMDERQLFKIHEGIFCDSDVNIAEMNSKLSKEMNGLKETTKSVVANLIKYTNDFLEKNCEIDENLRVNDFTGTKYVKHFLHPFLYKKSQKRNRKKRKAHSKMERKKENKFDKKHQKIKSSLINEKYAEESLKKSEKWKIKRDTPIFGLNSLSQKILNQNPIENSAFLVKNLKTNKKFENKTEIQSQDFCVDPQKDCIKNNKGILKGERETCDDFNERNCEIFKNNLEKNQCIKNEGECLEKENQDYCEKSQNCDDKDFCRGDGFEECQQEETNASCSVPNTYKESMKDESNGILLNSEKPKKSENITENEEKKGFQKTETPFNERENINLDNKIMSNSTQRNISQNTKNLMDSKEKNSTDPTKNINKNLEKNEVLDLIENLSENFSSFDENDSEYNICLSIIPNIFNILESKIRKTLCSSSLDSSVRIIIKNNLNFMYKNYRISGKKNKKDIKIIYFLKKTQKEMEKIERSLTEKEKIISQKIGAQLIFKMKLKYILSNYTNKNFTYKVENQSEMREMIALQINSIENLISIFVNDLDEYEKNMAISFGYLEMLKIKRKSYEKITTIEEYNKQTVEYLSPIVIYEEHLLPEINERISSKNIEKAILTGYVSQVKKMDNLDKNMLSEHMLDHKNIEELLTKESFEFITRLGLKILNHQKL